jgi:hypothetical protein
MILFEGDSQLDKSKILCELEKMYKDELSKPFPYDDTSRMKKDFQSQFSVLADALDFSPDFNNYIMTIAGSISYVFKGKEKEIPQKQVQLLNHNFFDRFPKYKFIEISIDVYSKFNDTYMSYERARKLLLDFLIS